MKKKVVNAFVDFGLLDFVQNLIIPRKKKNIHMELKGLLLLLGVLFYWLLTLKL